MQEDFFVDLYDRKQSNIINILWYDGPKICVDVDNFILYLWQDTECEDCTYLYDTYLALDFKENIQILKDLLLSQTSLYNCIEYGLNTNHIAYGFWDSNKGIHFSSNNKFPIVWPLDKKPLECIVENTGPYIINLWKERNI